MLLSGALILALGPADYQSLAGFVALVLGEVLNEAGSQILSLCSPIRKRRRRYRGDPGSSESTPGSSVGTSKSKCGIFLVGAFRMAPSRIASMMPRVSLMEIRLPVPFQPVLTR